MVPARWAAVVAMALAAVVAAVAAYGSDTPARRLLGLSRSCSTPVTI